MKARATRGVKAQATRRRRSAIDLKRTLALEHGGEAYRQKRREIARAATAVFNKEGLRGTSIGAVADALGLSRAALYYYVPSKNALFDELVHDMIESNVVRGEQIRAAGGSAVDRIRALILDMVRVGERDYPLYYIFLRENLSQVGADRAEWSRHVRRLSRRYEQILISLIQEGITAGELRPLVSPRIMAYGIFGMTGWTSRWFNPSTSLEGADEIGAAFAELVLSGIVAKGARRGGVGAAVDGGVDSTGTRLRSGADVAHRL